MKNYTFLGVSNNRCCILSCLLPFNRLVPDEIESSDFDHDCTDWCGSDSIDRTLKILKKAPTGKKIKLSKPIFFTGSDYDCGIYYPWKFEVDEIWELKRVYNKKREV